jgi:hypothetical protein
LQKHALVRQVICNATDPAEVDSTPNPIEADWVAMLERMKEGRAAGNAKNQENKVPIKAASKHVVATNVHVKNLHVPSLPVSSVSAASIGSSKSN